MRRTRSDNTQHGLDQKNLMSVYWEGSIIMPNYCEISRILPSFSSGFLSQMEKVKIYPVIQIGLTKLGVEVYALCRNNIGGVEHRQSI